MVAPKAHHSGRTTSASSPSTVIEPQKILRSILEIVSLLHSLAAEISGWRRNFGFVSKVLPGCGRRGKRASSTSLKSNFGLEFFHYALDQLFGVGEIFHDDLHIHDRLAGPALALAVDSVLAYEGHGVGDQVESDGEASAGHAQTHFEVFEFFLFFVEHGHGEIVA